MAEDDIVQRILLSGDDQMIAQLAAVARAGVKAFSDIEAAAAKASSGSAFNAISNSFTVLGTKFREIGTAAQGVGQSFGQLAHSAERSVKSITLMTGSVTLAAAALTKLIKGASDVGDNFAKNAQSVDLTTDRYQKLAFAAGQAGVDQDSFRTAMGRFVVALENSQKASQDYDKQLVALRRQLALGNITVDQYTSQLQDLRFNLSQAENPFKELGVTIAKNSDGNIDASKTFDRLADAMKNSNNFVRDAAKAREIFGRGSQRFILLLKQGSQALDEQGKEAQKLGLIISKDVIARQENLNDAFDKLGTAVNAFRAKVTAAFAPTAVIFIDKLVEAMGRLQESAIQAASTLASNLIPVIDDAISLIEGKKVDPNGFVGQMVEAFNALKMAAQGAASVIVPIFKAIVAAADVAAKAVNGIFGTKLSAGAVVMLGIITRLVGGFKLLGGAARVVGSIIGGLVSVFGGLTVILGGIAFVIGFTIVKALLKIDWKAVADKAKAAWQSIKDFAANAVQSVVNLWNGLVNLLSGVWQTIVDDFKSKINGIVIIAKIVAEAIRSAWNSVVSFFQDVWSGIKDGAQQAWDFITSVAGTVAQTVLDAWAGVVGFFQSLWQQVSTLANDAFIAASNAAQTGIDFIKGLFDGLLGKVQQVWDAIASKIRSVWNSVKDIVSGLLSAGGATATAGGGQGFAGGGLLRGPGGPTGDRIPIWGSDGEWMMRAKAVSHYGVAFMDAINNMRLNPEGLMLAFGGPVTTQPRLRYAEGGLVQGPGGGVLNLTIGDQEFKGLRAGEDTMEKLTRFATSRQVRSGGRKPTWFK